MSKDWQDYPKAVSPREYERMLEALNLNQLSAGRFLGVSPRTSRRYSSGDTEVPAAAVMLLRSMLQHGEMPKVKTRRAKRRRAIIVGFD